jgi:short-subunit dehydrogenase
VRTEFQERAGFKPQYDSAMLDVSAAEVARQGYAGLMANKRAVLPGFGIKAVPLMLRLFPRGFILWAIGHFQTKR